MRKSILYLTLILAMALLTGCGQAQNGAPPPEEPPQEAQQKLQQEAESSPEQTAEPVNDTPEPAPEPLPQPQADGTGIKLELPKKWEEKYGEGLGKSLQIDMDDNGNRVLYGVLHGYMESPKITKVSLASYTDETTEGFEDVISLRWAYLITLDDETNLQLKFSTLGFATDTGEIEFDDIHSAEVYPAFANYYWSLDCEDPEGWGDWVYLVIEGNRTQYYSISNDSLEEYFDDYRDYYGDSYGDSGAAYTPEEPTRLTQYEWPDYCDEADCLMMESVGLQYNEQWGTATKLLNSGSLITISILPKIGGGAEYGANIRVDNSTTIPVKSSDGINYQCKSTGGQGGNMGGYSGLWINLTKDGWSNWY